MSLKPKQIGLPDKLSLSVCGVSVTIDYEEGAVTASPELDDGKYLLLLFYLGDEGFIVFGDGLNS